MKQTEWIYQEFMDQNAERLPEEIFFADENGIIFASNRENRIGLYHEPSHKVSRQSLKLLVLTGKEGYIGAEEGASAPVFQGGKLSAVMTVTGPAQVCKELAAALTIAVEEHLKAGCFRKLHPLREEEMRNHFAKGICFDGYLNEQELTELARNLRIRFLWPRIPVLIKLPGERHVQQFAKTCRSLVGKEVLLTEAVSSDCLLLLIDAETDAPAMLSSYKYHVANAVGPILQYLRNDGIICRLAVGSWQEKVTDLPKSAAHCRWLLRETRGSERTAWFYDYLDEFCFSCVDQAELSSIFKLWDRVLNEKTMLSFMELLEALVQENFNLDRAAAALHMHKNTLAYRLVKIRDAFGMNPLINMRERQFMIKYYFYLRRWRQISRVQPGLA